MFVSVIILAILVTVLVIATQLYRVYTVTDILNDDGTDNQESSVNSLMGVMLFAFFVIGGFATFYYASIYWDEMNIPIASKHGKDVDFVFWLSMGFIIAAALVTNFLLLFFAFKYRYKKDRVAKFYPHNNTLEIIWTAVPALVLSILIFNGWKTWTGVMDKAPSDAVKVEIRGEQFKWQVRYPGKDNQFGKIDYKRIDPSNEFGMLCEDPASADDFFAREIHIPVNKPVLFKIRARDVIHSVFAPHFRLKMDAVPGMPTKFWFVPTMTTKQMSDSLNKPDFRYEIACAEVCGSGHFGMKKIIVVETEAEYKEWLSKQVAFFEKNPEVCTGNPVVTVEEEVSVVEENSMVESENIADTVEIEEVIETETEEMPSDETETAEEAEILEEE